MEIQGEFKATQNLVVSTLDGMRPRSHVNPGVECVRAGDRAFSLRPILSEFAVGYFIPAWEEEARELQSSVKLNGGNKFWAISGQ